MESLLEFEKLFNSLRQVKLRSNLVKNLVKINCKITILNIHKMKCSQDFVVWSEETPNLIEDACSQDFACNACEVL